MNFEAMKSHFKIYLIKKTQLANLLVSKTTYNIIKVVLIEFTYPML